ncbi:uncharacterized protein F5Z01DRAFT_290835 [Emericellopsis atlantica]|uniref:Uncharacterized protein n=1 Tax=Emericellopsis atlantica TaxID=2614577 RepID=A0A9P8CN24_9HYPO|nr:uncharacterized protein F5Z01DRAFT_290835 [Emericellopsis atlantica]KAG9251296.1 hypothetical protein F5Z01DRAFT_290835 [Emericellopsis atlantica]
MVFWCGIQSRPRTPVRQPMLQIDRIRQLRVDAACAIRALHALDVLISSFFHSSYSHFSELVSLNFCSSFVSSACVLSLFHNVFHKPLPKQAPCSSRLLQPSPLWAWHPRPSPPLSPLRRWLRPPSPSTPFPWSNLCPLCRETCLNQSTPTNQSSRCLWKKTPRWCSVTLSKSASTTRTCASPSSSAARSSSALTFRTSASRSAFLRSSATTSLIFASLE